MFPHKKVSELLKKKKSKWNATPALGPSYLGPSDQSSAPHPWREANEALYSCMNAPPLMNPEAETGDGIERAPNQAEKPSRPLSKGDWLYNLSQGYPFSFPFEIISAFLKGT